MSEAQIIDVGTAIGPTFDTALQHLESNEMLSLRFNEDRATFECTIHELSRHSLTKYGEGATAAAAILDLHPLRSMKQVEDYIAEREWTTEDPLSPEELAELKNEQSAS